MSWSGSGAGTHDHSSMGEERRSDILKLILYDLNSAIAPQDHRVLALQTAISEFDHDQDFKHDEELDLHADKILFQKLAFAFQVDRSSEEVAMICTALEMVYRASRPRVALSFAELRESVLPIFVEMLGKPLHLRKQEELDVALTEQEEKLDASREIFYGDHSRRSGSFQSHRSFSNPTDQSARSESVEEMSLQSAGKDYAFKSYQEPQNLVADDQSYISYDDYSPEKPGKRLDDNSRTSHGVKQSDDQSYKTYDESHGRFEKEVYERADPHTYLNNDQASREADQKSLHSNQHDDQSYDQYDKPTADDGTFRTYGEWTYQSHDKSLSKAVSAYDDQSYSSYEQSVQKGGHVDEASFAMSQGVDTYQDARSHDDGTYRDAPSRLDDQSNGEGTALKDCSHDGQSYQSARSYGEGTYQDDPLDAVGTVQDDQSQASRSSGESTFEEGETQGYDDGTFREDENQTYDDGTYLDGQSQALMKDEGTNFDGKSQNQNSYDGDKGDDFSYQGQSTIRTESRSVAGETQYTEEGYHSEEHSLQPTMYSERENRFRDDVSRADQLYSGESLQPSRYSKHAYSETVQHDEHSFQEGDEALCTRDRSYPANEEPYEDPDLNDDMSAFTQDIKSRADFSGQKGEKEVYEVETVYSEDNDEYSRNPSPVSSGDPPVKPVQASSNLSFQNPIRSTAIHVVSTLSTVAEESHEDSSMGDSKQSSWQKSRESGHSQPSILPSIDEVETIRSSRSYTSGSSSARALKERKLEQERLVSEQVARLEAELEMIRVEDTTNSVGVSRSLQVLRYFSRVLSAMVPMAHHPGLLNALVYQLERQPYGKHARDFNEFDDGEPRSEEDKEELAAARVDAIAIIVNLACAEENKAMMASHPGLLDVITTVARSDPSEEAREHASIVLMNLAYEDENKELMVQHSYMLETLVNLIQDNSPFTRRYASAAMFTLACVVGNSEKMAIYCDGEILECLRRVLADDPVDEARINAGEALFNMSRNNTEETLQTMGGHPRLLATLARAVLTDYSADVRVFCARALEWMAAGIHYPMDCHRLLLSALTVSAQWTKTSCIAEAMKTQATLAENRLPMASHDGLLQALSNLAMLESLTDTDVRKSAIAALEMLSRDERARPHMVKNEQVMRALTKASFYNGDDEVYGEDDQGTAVTTKLLKLALKNLSHEI